MSSILEALKKLEAEKSDQFPDDIPPDDAPDYSSTTLAERNSPSPPAAASTPALLWVLGGGIFTLMVIGVAVLLVMLLLQRDQTASIPNVPIAAIPSKTSLPASPSAIPTEPVISDTAGPTASSPPTPHEGLRAVTPAAEVPAATNSQPKAPKSVRPPVKQQPAPPRPQATAKPPVTRVAAPTQRAAVSVASTTPLPKDIRSLPMLSRNEKSQFRLDSVQLNMLNAAGPTRPLGNAFINLEKVFIGEFLPGTSARLIDVKGHGIAIEIQSTRQRYYIPR